MNRYEKPIVEELSFRPDEAIMDQDITDSMSGFQGGGLIPRNSVYDAHDNR